MRAISLFSGVGGFEIGFDRAGIDTILQVEIDKTCRAVLERHWPETERIADVRSLRMDNEEHRSHRSRRGADDQTENDLSEPDVWERRNGQHDAEGIDLVFGGFPCQDLSVAGNRAGLGGERSGLWFEFERVLSGVRPRWVVVENVPGLLSSNEGADFAIVISGLEELGYCVGWAVLDAQHFGVPQRRRRVFIVGGPGAASVRAVLSLCESCGGNPETRREAEEAVAGTLGGGSSERGWCDDTDRAAFIAQPLRTNRWGGSDSHGDKGNVVTHPALMARQDDDGFNLSQSVAAHGMVRRLTPRECERLQGWPDDWTRWRADGSEIADSARYRMIGNGVASPVAEWIGHRLVAVNMSDT